MSRSLGRNHVPAWTRCLFPCVARRPQEQPAKQRPPVRHGTDATKGWPERGFCNERLRERRLWGGHECVGRGKEVFCHIQRRSRTDRSALLKPRARVPRPAFGRI